jgi:large subunit ribosomal protein L5
MAFKEFYKTTVVPKMKKDFGYKNTNAVPVIKKVTLNIGLGKHMKDAKYLEAAENTLERITGQHPVKTKARLSISNFKIRQGNVIGMKVTLRGPRMWDFLEKLVKVSFPRVRDFRGISPKGFDGQGNYSVGFHEHIAFPEIRPDEIELTHGLQITISTTAESPKEGQALLKHLGFPFKEEK